MVFTVAAPDGLAVGLSEWAATGCADQSPRVDVPGCVLVGAYGWANDSAYNAELAESTAAIGPELYVYPAFPSRVTVSSSLAAPRLCGSLCTDQDAATRHHSADCCLPLRLTD